MWLDTGPGVVLGASLVYSPRVSQPSSSGSDLAAVNLTNPPGPPGQAGAGAGDNLLWSHPSHLTKHSTLLKLQTGLTVNVTEKDKIQF